jgi:multicomponent Na+:H+ antiporter subunit B
MIKKIFSFFIILGLLFIFAVMLLNYTGAVDLSGVAKDYVKRGPDELGAMNLVTAIVVTYRGFDTLGEVTVLFLAATGIAVFFRKSGEISKRVKSREKRDASEILLTGVQFLSPVILMFGVYIFINGHLSPGGGFQGGAVITTMVLLLFLSDSSYKINHKIFGIIESFSGASYVLIGLLGIFLAGGFLDNRILPLGEFGKILSAGAIPVIYSLIGLKVGTELASILDNMKGELE